MSFTTVEDGGTLQCRATIHSVGELEVYIVALEKRKAFFNHPASAGSTLTPADAGGPIKENEDGH